MPHSNEQTGRPVFFLLIHVQISVSINVYAQHHKQKRIEELFSELACYAALCWSEYRIDSLGLTRLLCI